MEKSLKEKILNELTEKEGQGAVSQERIMANYNILDKNLELAKKLITITEEGKVKILINKDKLNDLEKIALYLVGKAYAKHQGFTESEYATYDELSSELNIPKKSIGTEIRELRYKEKVIPCRIGRKVVYAIAPDAIELALKDFDVKAANNFIGLGKLRRHE